MHLLSDILECPWEASLLTCFWPLHRTQGHANTVWNRTTVRGFCHAQGPSHSCHHQLSMEQTICHGLSEAIQQLWKVSAAPAAQPPLSPYGSSFYSIMYSMVMYKYVQRQMQARGMQCKSTCYASVSAGSLQNLFSCIMIKHLNAARFGKILLAHKKLMHACMQICCHALGLTSLHSSAYHKISEAPSD